MADDPTRHAIDVVVRHISADAVYLAAVGGGLSEDYPGINTGDMTRITDSLCAEADRLNPTHEEYDAAYEHLASRAEGATP